MPQSVALVTVLVPDYDEGIAFYAGTLGFTLVEDTPDPARGKRWVVVAPPGGMGTRLLLARAAGPAQITRVGDQTGGRVGFFLHTDDFARDHAHYRSRGVEFVREPAEEPYGTVAVFRDPWGNLWDLLQPRGLGSGFEERRTDVNGREYLDDVVRRFRELRAQCDRALGQVPFERWSHRLDPGSNSLVTLMLHLSGNMRSRWTDFLTSDGEKPDRDRDAEFEDPASLTQDALTRRWEEGWATLFAALDSLGEEDLERAVTIRGEPHRVQSAIHRQLAHYATHTGQIVFLAKHLAATNWQTLSVPRGGSAAHNAEMERRTRREPT